MLYGSLPVRGFLRILGSLWLSGFLITRGSLPVRGFLRIAWLAIFDWFSSH
jgi:hypothetical protein